MAATKKITDDIAKDIRERYVTGEYTQAELASEFNVSVPTINKTVKGVAPEKRKYTHTTNRYVERDTEIVRLFNEEGLTTRQIRDRLAEAEDGFDMTHQNVSLILKKNGIVPRERYFSQMAEKREAIEAAREEERAARREAKRQAAERLSEAWKNGADIEEIRVMAGLKTANSTHVKIVNLRKQYGEDMFPKRAAFGMSEETREARRAERDEKAARLSELWKNRASNEELAAVFGWKSDTVICRIPLLRKQYGEDMFPYRRAPKNLRVEQGADLPEFEVPQEEEEVSQESTLTLDE
jgi:transposase